MKALFATCALLFALPASAACLTDGVVVFPRPGAVLPINAEFILEGRGTEVARVLALKGKRLRLVDDSGGEVALDVRPGWKSDMNRGAVRLVPRGKLKTDARYRLDLGALLPGARNLDPEGMQDLQWRTGMVADKQRPAWSKLPGPSEGRYFMDDGKLNRGIRFNMELEEQSPVYVVISIKRAKGKGVPQTYFAPLSSGHVTIGHDGCSGSFTFDDGRAYFARFEAYDAAGNRAPPVKPIEFHAPRPVRH